MKPVTAVLAASLAANAALGYFVVHESTPSSLSDSTDRSPPSPQSHTISVRTETIQGAATPLAASNAANTTHPWSHLDTDNLTEVLKRLHAAGFPSTVLRAVADQRYKQRYGELADSTAERAYWKSEAELSNEAGEKFTKLRAQGSFENIFGFDLALLDDDSRAHALRAYGNLPNDKIGRILAAQKSFADSIVALDRNISKDGNDLMTKTQAILRQQQETIAAILTPEELADYNLRSSTTAYALRRQLSSMHLSEAEYRSIYALQSAFDLQYPAAYGGIYADLSPAMSAANDALQAQIKTTLGDARFAEYQQSRRPENQELNQLVLRLDFPLSAAAQVIAIRGDVEPRANAIRVDSSLSAADRTQRLAALSDEASARVALAIGERGLEGYKQYGGNWLTGLVPAPAKKAPARNGSPARVP